MVRNSKGQVVGVIAIEIQSGERYYIESKCTMLATGGAGRIFKQSTNAYTCTGDGLGMVYRQGLPLQDMEMWQFHPTGIYGVGVLITEGARGEGGFCLTVRVSVSWSVMHLILRIYHAETSYQDVL